MLHIILLILKIIGILLLCVLGIVLAAVLCVLFVPFRYRVEVVREEGEGSPPAVVRAKITWLLHIVNVTACYPADVYVRARLFVFTLFQMPEKAVKAEPGQGHKQRKKPKSSAKDQEAPEKKTEKEPLPEEEKVEEQKMPAKDGQAAEKRPFFQQIYEKIRDMIAKISQIPAKIKEILQNIQYTIRSFCDKIKSVSDTAKYYCEVLRSDAFARSFGLCKDQLGVILRELKPDRFEADFIVGMEDPASTGQILAACGMLYPLIGQHVRVVGDFERAHIEGRLFLKGRIRVFTFLRVAVKVYRNKDIRTLIKLFKKEAV